VREYVRSFPWTAGAARKLCSSPRIGQFPLTGYAKFGGQRSQEDWSKSLMLLESVWAVREDSVLGKM
jgi:hypothetical protein